MFKELPASSALTLVTCALFAACASDSRTADSPPPPSPECPPGQTFDGTRCAPPPPAPYQSPPSPSTSTAAPSARTPAQGPGTTPLPPEANAAVTALIAPLATQHTEPGAEPLAPPIAGNFSQGQSLETIVQMQPGRCYTIVAVATPGVTNLDVQLMPQVPLPGVTTPVVAQDQTTAPTAVVGTKPNCFKWALPVPGPMKVVVIAAEGQGMAAAQVYVR